MFRRCARFAFVCASVGLVTLAGMTPAGARSGSRHAAFIMDANTGAVLHQDDADELRHPASLTKMMTLYLTFETLEQGRMSMSSSVTISQEAASVAPSKLDLDPGEELSVRDAILALITKSANDVAVALAEKIGGNSKNFVRLMNAKARELGMLKTNFENPSGLPDPDQVTTARDMVTLGLHLQDDFPQYYPLFATRAFTYAGHAHRNHNTLMNTFSGIDGIKTGYTQASGFNLVSSVNRSGRHLVGAVFGGSSAASRNAEMRMLLTRALNKASPVKTRKPQPAYIAKLKGEPKRAERPAKPKPVEVAQAETPPPPAAKPVRAAEPARPAASAEPSQQPAPAAKPRIAAAPAPAPAKPPVPAAAPPPAPAAVQAEDEAEAASPPVKAAEPEPQQVAQAGSAPISLTKVRRIMVAPRQGPKRPAPGPAETTDMDAADTTAGAADKDDGLPQISETIVAKTNKGGGAVYAVASNDKASMLGASDLAEKQTALDAASAEQPATAPEPETASVAPVRPVAAAARQTAPVTAQPAKAETVPTSPVKAAAASAKALPAPKVVTSALAPAAVSAKPAAKPRETPAAAVQRGSPPSSLNAQAAALNSGGPASARVASLSPATPALAGRFEIQIGAYNSVEEAQRALDAVHSRAGPVVANHASVTQPVSKGGRQIYRARFRGFDSASATSACGSLRQQSFDCFVMTAE